MKRMTGERSTQSTRRVLDALRRVVQSLRLSARAAESDLGLSGAQLFVLQKLSEERTLSVNDLAERTLTHQSSVSVVTARLVDKGLVARERSAKDARRLDLSITPKGRAMLRRSPLAAQERLLHGLAEMSERERAQLAALLERLNEGAGLADASPRMFFDGETAGASKRKGKQATRPGYKSGKEF
jgi:DNA-binding MarR family transcriptional regulator